MSSSVHTVTDLILLPGYINLDFADVKATLSNSGIALIGYGSATGPNKSIEAAENAINCPLLEAQISGARRAIVCITAGTEANLICIQECVDEITRQAGGQIDIVLGVSLNERLGDELICSIIATDFAEEFDFTSIPTYARVSKETALSGVDEARKAATEKAEAERGSDGDEDNFLESILPSFLSDSQNK